METRQEHCYVVLELDVANKNYDALQSWEKYVHGNDSDERDHFFLTHLLRYQPPIFSFHEELEALPNPAKQNLEKSEFGTFSPRRHVAEFSMSLKALRKLTEEYQKIEGTKQDLYFHGQSPKQQLANIERKLNRALFAVHFDALNKDNKWVRMSTHAMTISARSHRDWDIKWGCQIL